MKDLELLQNTFDKLKIKYDVFTAGIDMDDPIILMIKNDKYEECNFEFDPETEKFIKILF
jgi:hypothetical protein